LKTYINYLGLVAVGGFGFIRVTFASMFKDFVAYLIYDWSVENDAVLSLHTFLNSEDPAPALKI
jgi:hypothetical protein